MAISSSLSSSSTLFPLCNSTSISSKPTIFSFFSNASKQQSYRLSTTRVFAAPEVLDSAAVVAPDPDDSPSFYDPAAPAVEGIEIPDWDESQSKLVIRVKLTSYFVRLIEDACKQILDAAKKTNAKVSGPFPLPTKKRIYCALKSPHVHKDARFQFETRTHSRVIDILYPTANTIDALSLLDIPAGVDVQLTY